MNSSSLAINPHLMVVIGMIVLSGAILSWGLLIVCQLRFPSRREDLTHTLVHRSWSGRQVALLLGGFIGMAILLMLLRLLFSDWKSPASRLIPTLIFAATQLTILLAIGKQRQRDWAADFGMRPRKLKLLSLSLAIYLATIPLIGIVAVAYHNILEQQFGMHVELQKAVQLIAHSHSWVRAGFVVLAVFVAPLYEELIFRGVFFSYLVKRIGLFPGIFVVSMVFALLHFDIPSLLPLFVLSIVLCLSYWRTGSLWTNIGIHALFNGMTTAVLIATT